MMCRYEGGKAVAYLDLQIHLESREPPRDGGSRSSHFAAVESSFDIVYQVLLLEFCTSVFSIIQFVTVYQLGFA